MKPIYDAFVIPKVVDISLVDLLTRNESSKVVQAEPSISRRKIFEMISNGKAWYLPLLGLNLGETDPENRVLELREKNIPREEWPSFLINPWDKILFSEKGSLMQNIDHTNNLFVYHGTQEEALKEFFDAGYETIPLNYESREYGKYSDKLEKLYRDIEETIRQAREK